MMNPLVGGVLALGIAGLVTTAGQQFRAYSNGERTYVSALQGRPILALIVMFIVSAVGSLLMSLVGGSLGLFPYLFVGFSVFGVAVLLWGLAKQRR